MSSEILQYFMSIVYLAGFFFLIWLITKFRKPVSLEIKFGSPRKEAALAIGYVIGFFLVFAMVISFLAQRAGGPLGTPAQFDLQRALRQWAVYAVISIVPISVIIKTRKQSFETVGVTSKNLELSFGIGNVISILLVILVVLSMPRELFLYRFFSSNTLYAFIYFLAVGFGEELMFRGFLQLRCSIWLGEIKGLILASTIMALVHIPQRIFAVGLEPLSALVSAVSLMPISLLFGFFMLRTRNILGPAVLHTVIDWVSVL